jgi:hypothetical protein
MLGPYPRLARLAASGVFLFAFNLSIAAAGDHTRREPTFSHWASKWRRYTRETSHGLIQYPCTTYWASGDATNSIDRWDVTDRPTYSSYDITPSPWAYRTIAPYRHQYHSFDGTGFCASECYDCRN